ncbi:hypothetical protein V7139_20465 [Neobacillus drentensis]|uniref:hypothetical protein n=1 Tax=Neobacillus drentensis TaxID=220684 RepID=UPI00300295F5
MKKIVVGILSAAFILGAGTAVFAAGNGHSDNGVSFEKMLPFMQKMHPDSSKAELKDMYKACQENGGMMGDTKVKEMDSENMMNRF